MFSIAENSYIRCSTLISVFTLLLSFVKSLVGLHDKTTLLQDHKCNNGQKDHLKNFSNKEEETLNVCTHPTPRQPEAKWSEESRNEDSDNDCNSQAETIDISLRVDNDRSNDVTDNKPFNQKHQLLIPDPNYKLLYKKKVNSPRDFFLSQSGTDIEKYYKGCVGKIMLDVKDGEKEKSTFDSYFQLSPSKESFSSQSILKRKEQDLQVGYVTVSAHHPSEINKIPWKLMNWEWWRLHTFSKFPRNSPCSSILLARQGFVHIGNGNLGEDTIICVFCSAAASDLYDIKNTEIENLHARLNPNCPIVKGEQSSSNMLMKVHDEKTALAFLSLLKKEESFSANASHDQQDEIEIDHPMEPTASHHTVPDSATVADQTYSNSPTCLQASKDNGPYDFVTSYAHALPNTIQDGTQIASPSNVQSDSFHAIYAIPERDGASSSNHLATAKEQDNSYSTSHRTGDSGLHDNIDDLPSGRHQESLSGSQTQADHSSPARNSQTSDSISQANPDSISQANPDSISQANPDSISEANPDRTSQPNPDRTSQANPDRTSQANPDRTSQANPDTNSQANPDSTPAPQGNTSSSYETLGIITARPKRHEYAVEITRLHSFDKWPKGHHIKGADLAKAGYFYTGYSDCARCFYCGGGLRNWEADDDVWVEHARWFPKCAFIRQSIGQPFIDVVQDLSKDKEIILYDEITALMDERGLDSTIPRDLKDNSMELTKDAAVKTVIDSGFSKADVINVAGNLKESGVSVAADAIYDELIKRKIRKTSAPVKMDFNALSVDRSRVGKQDKETIESLKGENNDLRQQSQCKICMDKEVSVVFLPCGHLISCNECSFPLKICPVCRDNIKGVVRAYLG